MEFEIDGIQIGEKYPLVVISGPCVIEDETHTLQCASHLQELCSRCGVQLIFKASYDKGNRSSLGSYRGPGIKKGLTILRKVKREFNLPILTDIHHPEEVASVAEACDIIQVPAFLCRQTDLLLAVGESHVTVNVKKGQFMDPWSMEHVLNKIVSTGNHKIILTERGYSFGYNNLIVDMRAIPILKKFGFPVCFDGSHSVQLPGGMGDHSGGQREFISPLVKAALGAGAHLLFIESHPNPKAAKSDKHSVMPYDLLERLLQESALLYECLHKNVALC